MPSHLQYRSIFASRVAHPVKSYGNIALPFSLEIWLLIAATGAIFSFLFFALHTIYKSALTEQGLHRDEESKINFLLYTISKVTEPDPLPWFTEKWSTGKFMTALWAIWALLMVNFYTSNLRAHMTSPKYEKNLDTVQDVANNKGRAWIARHFAPMQPLYLEMTGQTDGPLYRISKRAFEEDSLMGEVGLPEAVQVRISDIEDITCKQWSRNRIIYINRMHWRIEELY